MPPSPNAVPIAFFSNLTGEITPVGETDYFTFQAASGDTININAARIGGSGDVCIRLIDPDGAIGSFACADQRFGQTAAGISQRLTKSGVYAVEIAETGDNGTVAYRLDLQCIGVCPTAPPPTPSFGCTFSVSPTSQVFAGTAGTSGAGVFTSPGCAWNAVSNVSFASITSGANGNGPGTVAYTVAANAATAARTGTLTIAGQTLGITQSGSAPLFTAGPSLIEFRAREGGARPEDQTVSIFTNQAALSYSARAATTSGGNWLALNPTKA